MSEEEPEEKEKEAKPVRAAAVPARERREAKAVTPPLGKKREEVSLKMAGLCRCPMWAPEKLEEREKWIKEMRKRMREMSCMCPMWKLEEEQTKKE